MAQDIAVYVHFPYCKSRCPYCDYFRSLLPKNFDEEALINEYMQDLYDFHVLIGERAVKSVFFGGGTPSLFSVNGVGRVLEAIHRYFPIHTDAEISLEANPNSSNIEKFRGFRDAGINRLSLGVQALNESDLKLLGRTHSLSEALHSIENAVDIFPKSSIDLIYARPNQTWEPWKQELNTALSFGLKHISLYQLTIMEGTAFYRKKVQIPDENQSADLYEKTVDYLHENGLERYEVSNFAVPNFESKHNLVYWQGGNYIGLGAGGCGRLRLSDGQIIATEKAHIVEELTKEERAEELVLMGLRIKDGIKAHAFKKACGLDLFEYIDKNVVKNLAKLNLMCYSDDEIKLTDKGFMLLDEIVLELIK